MASFAPAVPVSHDPAVADLIESDRALASIGRRIKVLKAIDWPQELEERFLSAWRAGRPELPAPDTQPQTLPAEMDALGTLMRRIDRGHPIGNWLFKSHEIGPIDRCLPNPSRLMFAQGS